ncbi:MAG: hypothetical protein ACXQT1_05395 [Methermicoccaceae archaeon]
MNVSELILEGERVVFTYEHKAVLGYTDFYITDRKSIVLRRGSTGGLSLSAMFHDRLAGASHRPKVYRGLKRLGKWLIVLGVLAFALWLLVEAIKSSQFIANYIVLVRDFTYLRNAGAVLLLAGIFSFLLYWGYRPNRVVLEGGGASVEVPKMPEEKVEEIVRLLTNYREHYVKPPEKEPSLSFEIPKEDSFGIANEG